MKLLEIYLWAVNLAALGMMGLDKYRAVRHRWRIPERYLFASALLGGGLGAVLGMCLFHHKTRTLKFQVGMPLILVAQVAVFCLVILPRL